MSRQSVKRADFDFILGKADYEPGFIDALLWAVLCTLLAFCAG